MGEKLAEGWGEIMRLLLGVAVAADEGRAKSAQSLAPPSFMSFRSLLSFHTKGCSPRAFDFRATRAYAAWVMQFENVTAIAKANVYFDGNVVSHGIVFPD